MNSCDTDTVELSNDEIISAFQRSGYPLEIRLAQTFANAGMNPVIGFRVTPSGSTETREVDVIASLDRFVVVGERPLRVSLRLVVEAKSMPRGAAFVGLPWIRPEQHELRVARMYFGGRPSNRILGPLDRDGDVIIGNGGLSEAFDAMNDAPVCVQWANARRMKAGKGTTVGVNHEPPFWSAIDDTVRACDGLARGFSEFVVRSEHLALIFEMPMVVIATPKLKILDCSKDGGGALSDAPRLVLSRMFEIKGRVEHRLVDIVAESGLPDFIEACRHTMDGLEQRVSRHTATLVDLAAQQREQHERSLIEEAAPT